jgi:hypothetical protein
MAMRFATVSSRGAGNAGVATRVHKNGFAEDGHCFLTGRVTRDRICCIAPMQDAFHR